ncbi:MAG: tRNA (adenosine(37)-N6)-threonylcarbamoyltransferase complex transferase subunit TsaD [Sumerlaeia bacterium]
MRVLGIESSCDETAFAVVENGVRVLSNAIASQIDLHARYGGVVPEIASRAHLEAVVAMHRAALQEAGVTMDDIDAIAVTRGPGLSGCLLVGTEYAKALALRHGKPLIAVHHIAGHIDSVNIGRTATAWGDPVEARAAFAPYVALVVSGGHSSLVHVRGPMDFLVLGETLDDAVGEAYDKVAKLLGLGYPGGPAMDRLAGEGHPQAFDLPRPMVHSGDYNFSFSGLKTSVARTVEKHRAESGARELAPRFLADLAASFQAACVDVLLRKAARALEETRVGRLAITGGVACNRGLRAEAARRFPKVQIAIPASEFCTDNAAMIAGLGGVLGGEGLRSGLGLNALPGLGLGDEGRWQE